MSQTENQNKLNHSTGVFRIADDYSIQESQRNTEIAMQLYLKISKISFHLCSLIVGKAYSFSLKNVYLEPFLKKKDNVS